MKFGYCTLHEVSLIADCINCFSKWPNNKKFTRAQCKRQNWNGYVDVNKTNEFTHEQIHEIHKKMRNV